MLMLFWDGNSTFTNKRVRKCFVKMTLAKCQKLSCWRSSIGKKGWPCRRFFEAKARDLKGSELRPRIPPRGSTSDILFSLLTFSFLTLQSQAALPMLDECGFVHGFRMKPKGRTLICLTQFGSTAWWWERVGEFVYIYIHFVFKIYSLLINHHESAAWSKMGACEDVLLWFSEGLILWFLSLEILETWQKMDKPG